VQTQTDSPPGARQSSLGYLPGLDGLRAISVLAVLAFHYYFIGGHSQGFASGGFLGVEVFFVVSGYLITSLLLAERRNTKRISLGRFWFRRARRLLPALYVMLAVVVLYALLFLPDSINKLKSDSIAALTYTSNWWLIASHQSYAAEAGRPALLKHLWSLAIEEQFYLLWPPLLILGLRKLTRERLIQAMLAGALASTVLMAVVAQGSINAAYYSLDTRLSGLLLGSVMAFFFAPYQIRGKPGRGARVVLDLTGLFGLLVLLWTFGHFTFPISTSGDLSVFHGGFLLVDLATLLVIAAVVHPRSDVGGILGCAPLRWIGVRSYSLYLWHYPIFCITRPGLDVPFHGWSDMVLRLGLSFGAADLSYRYVERPIRNGAIGRYLNRVREEHGERRQRAARRGVIVTVSALVVVFGLGAGLASKQGQTEKIPGFNGKGAAAGKGSAVNQQTLESLRHAHDPKPTGASGGSGRAGSGASGGTGGSGPVPTTVAAGPSGAHPGTTVPAVAATTVPKVLTQEILAVGDSVMLGAQQSLQRDIPGIFVDAKVSRQFWDATVVLQAYKNEGLLPPTVVIHMGTNGAFSDSQFAQMMAVLGKRKVFFVNAREPRSWETEVNQRLANDVRQYPNAHLIDWHDYGNQHPNWFVADGIHLTGAGAQGYAGLIREHLIEGH
jgi:peptidoglycan/LPS O-acetylase OafA/YrhL